MVFIKKYLIIIESLKMPPKTMSLPPIPRKRTSTVTQGDPDEGPAGASGGPMRRSPSNLTVKVNNNPYPSTVEVHNPYPLSDDNSLNSIARMFADEFVKQSLDELHHSIDQKFQVSNFHKMVRLHLLTPKASEFLQTVKRGISPKYDKSKLLMRDLEPIRIGDPIYNNLDRIMRYMSDLENHHFQSTSKFKIVYSEKKKNNEGHVVGFEVAYLNRYDDIKKQFRFGIIATKDRDMYTREDKYSALFKVSKMILDKNENVVPVPIFHCTLKIDRNIYTGDLKISSLHFTPEINGLKQTTAYFPLGILCDMFHYGVDVNQLEAADNISVDSRDRKSLRILICKKFIGTIFKALGEVFYYQIEQNHRIERIADLINESSVVKDTIGSHLLGGKNIKQLNKPKKPTVKPKKPTVKPKKPSVKPKKPSVKPKKPTVKPKKPTVKPKKPSVKPKKPTVKPKKPSVKPKKPANM